MLKKIEDYIPIVGDNVIAELHRKARKLYNKHVIHINSTFMGGGVAEILSTLVPMMNDAGVDAGWRGLKNRVRSGPSTGTGRVRMG